MFDGLPPEAGYRITLRLLHGLAIKLFHDYSVGETSNYEHLLYDSNRKVVTHLRVIEQKLHTYLIRLKRDKNPSLKTLYRYRELCMHTQSLVMHVEPALFQAAVRKLFSCYSSIFDKMAYNSPSYRTYTNIYNNVYTHIVQAMFLHELYMSPEKSAEQHADNVKHSLSILFG